MIASNFRIEILTIRALLWALGSKGLNRTRNKINHMMKLGMIVVYHVLAKGLRCQTKFEAL